MNFCLNEISYVVFGGTNFLSIEMLKERKRRINEFLSNKERNIYRFYFNCNFQQWFFLFEILDSWISLDFSFVSVSFSFRITRFGKNRQTEYKKTRIDKFFISIERNLSWLVSLYNFIWFLVVLVLVFFHY